MTTPANGSNRNGDDQPRRDDAPDAEPREPEQNAIEKPKRRQTGGQVVPRAEITLRQRRFVREYLTGRHAGNGTRSAIAAGYPEAGACVRASMLLRKKKIRRVIDRHIANAAATTDRLLAEAFKVATARAVDAHDEAWGVKPPSAIDDFTAAAIASVTRKIGPDGSVSVTVKMHPKTPAIALLLKARGLAIGEEAAQSFTINIGAGGNANVDVRPEAPQTRGGLSLGNGHVIDGEASA